MATIQLCDICDMPIKGWIKKKEAMCDEEKLARTLLPFLFQQVDGHNPTLCPKCKELAVKQITDIITARRQEVSKLKEMI